MDTRQRAMLFSRYAGLELKGKITARGYTAKDVAASAHRSAAAFNRWLNGHVELPLTVLCEACEIIGVEPRVIVDAAYDRVLTECGRRDVQSFDESPDVRGASDNEALPLAAKRGRRKADVDPAD